MADQERARRELMSVRQWLQGGRGIEGTVGELAACVGHLATCDLCLSQKPMAGGLVVMTLREDGHVDFRPESEGAGLPVEATAPEEPKDSRSEPTVMPNHQWWCGGKEPCACMDSWKETRARRAHLAWGDDIWKRRHENPSHDEEAAFKAGWDAAQ